MVGAVSALSISIVGVLVATYLGRAACSQVSKRSGWREGGAWRCLGETPKEVVDRALGFP